MNPLRPAAVPPGMSESIDPSRPKPMRATCDGVTIAESDATVLVEGNHYFPADAVRWELMTLTSTKTICPWKGLASYYDVDVSGVVQPRAAWSYRRPLPWIRRIGGRVAFAGAVRVHR